MDVKQFLFQVSLIERFCILLLLISWYWVSAENPYSKLEAFMATVLSAVINWCYLFFNETYNRDFSSEMHHFHNYWHKAFWVERYALLQLLLVCWFPISDPAASAIVGVSALIVFVFLPLL